MTTTLGSIHYSKEVTRCLRASPIFPSHQTIPPSNGRLPGTLSQIRPCTVAKYPSSSKIQMAQPKAKAQKGVAQKHLHSRISYLYQAATCLADQAVGQGTSKIGSDSSKPRQEDDSRNAISAPEAVPGKDPVEMSTFRGDRKLEAKSQILSSSNNSAVSRQLLTHLRVISLKSQIRLTPTIKHGICKRCDLLLVPGSTSTIYIENKSRRGRKSWADVLVVTCFACGTEKRLPVGAKRQLKRQARPTLSTDDAVHDLLCTGKQDIAQLKTT